MLLSTVAQTDFRGKVRSMPGLSVNMVHSVHEARPGGVHSIPGFRGLAFRGKVPEIRNTMDNSVPPFHAGPRETASSLKSCRTEFDSPMVAALG